MLAKATWARDSDRNRAYQAVIRDTDFERVLLDVHATNGTMLLEKILVSLGYTRIKAGKEWKVTAYAMDPNGNAVLLFVCVSKLRTRVQEDMRMPFEGYPSPLISEGLIATLRNMAAAFLYDHPEYSSVRVDYIAIPETITMDQVRSNVPITLKRGLTWRMGSRTDVGLGVNQRQAT